MNHPLVPFYFMRHGQTAWNAKFQIMGSQDISLNSTGIIQIHETIPLLKPIEISMIVSSSLKRCIETSTILYKALNKPCLIIDELKECCWGTLEGKAPVDFNWLINWKKGINIEGSETYIDFTKRVLKGLEKALSLPPPVLIVSHNIVYNVIQELFNFPTLTLENASIVFHRPPERIFCPWFVYKLNDL